MPTRSISCSRSLKPKSTIFVLISACSITCLALWLFLDYGSSTGPSSFTTKPICPDSDIPELVGQRKPNLNETTTAHAEEHIFGPSAGKVRTAVKRANEILLKKLVDPKTGNINHVDWLFDQVLDPEAMHISNYWYLPGGHWKPMNCLPKWKVAILIPFRDRFVHLPIFLQNLIPMLQKQLLEFSFFVVEQANQELFNRAMLMNVGFLESLNFTDYDCFIIHDVDHVPIDDHNYYGCSRMPRHFISGDDYRNYKLPYADSFGGVTGFTKANIRSINGFPNVYWGWGCEDDEILLRVKDARLKITRDKGPIGYYNVIMHHHEGAPKGKDRRALLGTFKRRIGMDGLSNIVYPTPVYDLHTLYTNVSVDIKKIKPHY
ncbi:beta-1,4-galactosyltransferase 5-like [Strongylocentrotus purpuratus]|uniref:Beta-1,4-galactosyltransferase n=1 Tax=Strongylocentrotus purpuratus TaxID=7668 RepID=A0A7M7SUB9_STRPU|nr:beta-1,4-galactosyltransferase 5-like [Strongylocentrotus purpuratus]